MKTTNPPLPRVLGHAVLWGLLAAWPQTSGAVIRLVDVAARAGITLLNVCGGPSKDYIVEVNGNGAAFFDYDNVSKMSARSRSQRFEAAAVISRTTTCASVSVWAEGQACRP